MLSELIWPSKPSFRVSSEVWMASSSSMSSLYLVHDMARHGVGSLQCSPLK